MLKVFGETHQQYTQGLYDWIYPDTRQNFEKNQPAHWSIDSLNYILDCNGFRNKADPKKGLVYNAYFGCSHTMGIGMPVEHIWPTLVNSHSDLPMINFGVTGGTPETVYRLYKYYSQLYIFKNVYILLPHYARREVFDSIHKKWITDVNFGKDETLRFLSDEDLTISRLRITDAIHSVAVQNNHHLVLKDVVYSGIDKDVIQPDETARDCKHPGYKAHNTIASIFLKG
jgi:hypothetical protein